MKQYWLLNPRNDVKRDPFGGGTWNVIYFQNGQGYVKSRHHESPLAAIDDAMNREAAQKEQP